MTGFTKCFIISIFFVTLASVTVPSSYAFERPQVLGLTTQQIIMPPTSEGPGYILPDSPLYFLDKLKQKIRILFAFTSLQKAQVYSSIAGERIAETRVELANGNIPAAEIALDGLKKNTRSSADEFAKAKFAGSNVVATAVVLNRTIAERQKLLDVAEQAATGELKAEIGVVQAAFSDAKGVIEEGLPADELANAVRDDLTRDAGRFAIGTSNAAAMLRISLDVLQQQATIAAKENLTKRQDALKQAIAANNKALQTVEQQNLDLEKQKEALSQALQAQAENQAQDVEDRAKQVANTVKTSLQVMQGPTPTPTPTPAQK